MADFMPQKEFTGLQGLNKFCYTIAVGRVQTRFDLGLVCFSYFTHPLAEYSDKVIKYDWRTDKVKVIERKGLFNFRKCLTVQVKRDIYAMRSVLKNSTEYKCKISFTRFGNVESASPSVTTLSVPQMLIPQDEIPGVVNFKDQALYMIGGMAFDDES